MANCQKIKNFVVPGAIIINYTYNLYTDLNPTEPFPYTDKGRLVAFLAQPSNIIINNGHILLYC